MGFASSGPAVWQLWQHFALSGPSRFRPGADQGGIKVAACFSNAFLDPRMLAMS
jgi:hypothetical protein